MRINNLSVIYYTIYNLNSVIKFLDLHKIEYSIEELEDCKYVQIIINGKKTKSPYWIVYNHITKTTRIMKKNNFSLIEYDYNISKTIDLLFFSKEHTKENLYTTSKNKDLVKLRSIMFYGLISLGYSVSELAKEFSFDKTTINHNINKLYDTPEIFNEIDKKIIQ